MNVIGLLCRLALALGWSLPVVGRLAASLPSCAPQQFLVAEVQKEQAVPSPTQSKSVGFVYDEAPELGLKLRRSLAPEESTGSKRTAQPRFAGVGKGGGSRPLDDFTGKERDGLHGQITSLPHMDANTHPFFANALSPTGAARERGARIMNETAMDRVVQLGDVVVGGDRLEELCRRYHVREKWDRQEKWGEMGEARLILDDQTEGGNCLCPHSTICTSAAIVEVKTGALRWFPFQVGDCQGQKDHGLHFRPDSHLLVAKGALHSSKSPEAEPCGTYYFEWTGRQFRRLTESDLRNGGPAPVRR